MSDPHRGMPARVPADEVLRQRQVLERAGLVVYVLEAVPGEVVVLDSSHQVVFSNPAFGRRITGVDPTGLRVGDALACIHAVVSDDGCGTMSPCEGCGLMKATSTALGGCPDVQELRINVQGGGGVDLQLSTTPLLLEGETLVLCCIVDRGSDRRRRMLERIFFHDVLNTAGGLYGMADLLCESADGEGRVGRLARTIFSLSASMIEEIESQKDLVAAENHDLVTQDQQALSRELLDEVANAYLHHEVARGKRIQVEDGAQDILLRVDRTILRRVLGNMLKNALEASRAGECVTLDCTRLEGDVLFEVHNPGHMPREVQAQVFKRSFSTKGADRGVGTYSIKLLTETYLHGTVSFVSDLAEGTTFRVTVPVTPPA